MLKARSVEGVWVLLLGLGLRPGLGSARSGASRRGRSIATLCLERAPLPSSRRPPVLRASARLARAAGRRQPS
jgi:hypothetical protein